MKIVGYADRLSVLPGETISFMVSCKLPAYRADIVRLTHGDPNPRGPGFKAEPVDTPATGEYPGRSQAIVNGSYALVPDHPLLRAAASLTLQAWIYPTTPRKGLQGVLTKWSAKEERGYGLFIDEGGELALWMGAKGGRVYRISSGQPLRERLWYFVAGAFDPESRTATIYQEPLRPWPSEDSAALVERRIGAAATGDSHAPFLMAGYQDTSKPDRPVGGFYNGKIDSPRLFRRALSLEEIIALKQGASPSAFGADLVAAWDLSTDISSSRVTDTSPHKLHGTTVNRPARAMTGHSWSGREVDFKHARDQYGAIHFHDDDLDDAGWKVDFRLTIPPEMKSGIYAARLRARGAEDYIPFFVRPGSNKPGAKVLFLVPTFSYLAYANWRINTDRKTPFSASLPEDFRYPAKDEDKYIVEERLLSLYNRHVDGSGVCYSSRLRPIVSMRPKYHSPELSNGKGSPHQLGADLHLVDWLAAKGHQFDVATDEDLHREGLQVLAPYRAVVTGSHPEYWSEQMLDALESYLGEGGRLMYLGGNGFYWITSLDPESGHTIEVRRWGGTQSWNCAPGERYHSTTGEIGGIWRNRGRAPQRSVGVGFTSQGNDRNRPYQREPGSRDPRAAFIFEGVEEDELIGDFPSLVLEHGAAGFELDRVDYGFGTPSNTIVLASATGFSDSYQHVIEEEDQSDSRQGGTVNPLVKSDMVFVPYPKGGAVFSVGSISWCGSLSYNDYNNNVSRITDNVLRRFSSEAPLL